MGSTDESFSNTGYELKDYFLTETYVEFNQESMTEQRFPKQRFFEDVDCASIGEMLFNAYREQVYHSQRVSRRRPCPIERRNPLLKQWQKATIERGNPLWKPVKNKTLNSQRLGLIWTDRGSKSSPTVRRRLEKHEFQADYDRRSIQKLSETIESQREELHRAQAEELYRRDQQLLHEQ